jgi:serine/threonine protein kinase
MNTNDPAALAIGYELEAVAARTEHSIVFVAQERRTAVRVAVKLALDSDGTDALRREIQVLRGLRHPHIIKVVDAVATGDPWMVMPLAATSLEDLVATGREFTAEEVAGMIVAIASALQNVHRHRLVHADVKPANILFDAEDGRPLLADFGAAHVIGTRPTSFTPTYFVDDGIEGDVAALARSALHMLGDADGIDLHALRTVVREFARLGDRPELLVQAVTAIVSESCWPEVRALPSSSMDAGPPTQPFGPRPPLTNDAMVEHRRRNPRRLIALIGAAAIIIGAMHIWREHSTPSPAAIAEVHER